MIRHIVLWKFREGTEAAQEEFLTALQGLYGVIPEIRNCEVRKNVTAGEYDAALIADFDDHAALERYLADPRHVAVSALCKAIRTDRAAVDYAL